MDGNADTGYGLITANIRKYAENMKTILVTGTADEAVLSEVTDRLAAGLAGIHVMAGGNMLQDAETLKKLPECDGVVLVEQCMDAKYSTVAMEIERVTDLQKSVIGCVVFE